MTARKLPSGNYKARAYDYTDANGKKHYKSFTATTKREAERLAMEWMVTKDNRSRHDLTVMEAISGYIAAKEKLLSPSTVRVYMQLRDAYYDPIATKRIQKITTPDLQRFVSDLSAKVSPKSVSNIYGLLASSLSLYMPERTFKVTLPKRIKQERISPSDADVRRLFDISSDTMKKCIALAAFASLRRGEICSLTFRDLDGNMLHVHSDMVQAPDRSWVVKEVPKTSDSIRHVMLPDAVIDLLGTGAPDERIISCLPSTITKEFTKFRDRAGVSVCFHQLRHYYASIGAALGIPDIYLADFGGWSASSNVMKEVYQNKIVPLSEAYAKKMTDHFDGILKRKAEDI